MRIDSTLFLSSLACLALAAACGDDGDGHDHDHDIDAAETIDAPSTIDAPGDTPDAEEGTADADTTDATDNAAPTASFEFGPPCTTTNETEINFTSTSMDTDGDQLSCSWVFNSGTPGTADTCVVNGVTFPNLNPYTVTLTVDDGNGGTDVATDTVPPCNNP